jgi:hypothetical protein
MIALAAHLGPPGVGDRHRQRLQLCTAGAPAGYRPTWRRDRHACRAVFETDPATDSETLWLPAADAWASIAGGQVRQAGDRNLWDEVVDEPGEHADDT